MRIKKPKGSRTSWKIARKITTKAFIEWSKKNLTHQSKLSRKRYVSRAHRWEISLQENRSLLWKNIRDGTNLPSSQQVDINKNCWQKEETSTMWWSSNTRQDPNNMYFLGLWHVNNARSLFQRLGTILEPRPGTPSRIPIYDPRNTTRVENLSKSKSRYNSHWIKEAIKKTNPKTSKGSCNWTIQGIK